MAKSVEFTPGPWEVEEELCGHDYAISASTWGGLARVVAEMDDDGSGKSFTKSEQGWANAQLIATAPQMYKALKKLADRVIEYFPKGKISPIFDADIEVRQFARDALAVVAKAKCK